MPYFEKAGAASPALEFLSPIKGPTLEQILIEVGSGIRTAESGAKLYDEDVKKQAQQLGLPGWDWSLKRTFRSRSIGRDRNARADKESQPWPQRPKRPTTKRPPRRPPGFIGASAVPTRYWFYLPAAVLFGVLFIVPTFASFFFSLTRWTLFDYHFIGLDNYRTFFSEPALVQGPAAHADLRRRHLRREGRPRACCWRCC